MRGRCRNRPAGLCRTGHGLHRDAQQQDGDTVRFRRQHQPSADGQVDSLRLAPEVDHDCADRPAVQRIIGGTQQRRGIMRRHEQTVARVQPDFTQAMRVDRPTAAANAQPCERSANPPRAHGGKPGRAGSIIALRRNNFMQPGTGKTAAQHLVNLVMPQRGEITFRSSATA